MSSPAQIAHPFQATQSTHLIVEFYGARNLTDAGQIAEALKIAAQRGGAIVLDARLHDFGDHQGVTGIVLLAESHISIHTWPEHDYAAIDIFMCGQTYPDKSVESLREFFQPESVDVQRLIRGARL